MINRIILIGNLGKDAETRTLPTGTELTKFSIATSRSYRDKAGEWQQDTQWHDIAAWGNAAARAANLRKGQTVYVEGELNYNEYEDKNGSKQRRAEVRASYFRILSKNETETPEQRLDRAVKVVDGGMTGGVEVEKQGDDLPF